MELRRSKSIRAGEMRLNSTASLPACATALSAAPSGLSERTNIASNSNYTCSLLFMPASALICCTQPRAAPTQRNPILSQPNTLTAPAQATVNQTRQCFVMMFNIHVLTAVPLLADGQHDTKTKSHLFYHLRRDAAGRAPVFGAEGNLSLVQREQENRPGTEGETGEGCMHTGRSRVSCQGTGVSTKAKSESQGRGSSTVCFFFF